MSGSQTIICHRPVMIYLPFLGQNKVAFTGSKKIILIENPMNQNHQLTIPCAKTRVYSIYLTILTFSPLILILTFELFTVPSNQIHLPVGLAQKHCRTLSTWLLFRRFPFYSYV